MEENTIKISHILFMILMMGIVIIVGTYAWLSYRSNDTAMVLTIGEINNVQVTLSPYQIKASLLPQVTYTSDNYTSVTAVNNSSSSRNIRLFYRINSIDSELISSDFKYTIERSTDNITYSEYKNGNFSSASNGAEITILEESMPGNNTTYQYKVYLWIDGSNSGQSYMQGKSFNGELRATIAENQYQVTFNPNGGALYDNLLYGLENVGETVASYMKYSISNGTITVTATRDDGYGFTTGRVDFEAGKTYKFTAITDGIWGGQNTNNGDSVEACLMLNGQYNTYYCMNNINMSNNGYNEFTPTVTGTYFLRLDVNKNGKTHIFSNISIVEKNNEPKIVTVGNPYGILPTPTRDGYTFLGWNGKNLLYGLDDIGDTTSVRINYSISGGVVTVTSTNDAGYGFTTGRVYLESNKNYIFSCNTDQNAVWGQSVGDGSISAYFMLNGQYNTYYGMGSNSMNNNGYYEFTPTVTGTYWLRLDVHKENQTNTFSNISIVEKDESESLNYAYEPYYITSNTTVVQNKDHILKAIWQEN